MIPHDTSSILEAAKLSMQQYQSVGLPSYDWCQKQQSCIHHCWSGTGKFMQPKTKIYQKRIPLSPSVVPFVCSHDSDRLCCKQLQTWRQLFSPKEFASQMRNTSRIVLAGKEDVLFISTVAKYGVVSQTINLSVFCSFPLR